MRRIENLALFAALSILCSYWTHEIMDNYYDMDGYPGNEDTGAMGSWYVFSAIGLFSNAGQDYYVSIRRTTCDM